MAWRREIVVSPVSFVATITLKIARIMMYLWVVYIHESWKGVLC